MQNTAVNKAAGDSTGAGANDADCPLRDCPLGAGAKG